MIEFVLTGHGLEHADVDYPQKVREVVSVIKGGSRSHICSLHIDFLSRVDPSGTLVHIGHV